MQDIKTLMMYPIILFLSWIWIIIERVTEIFTTEDNSNWLNHMDLSLATLNGFLNALVYGFISLDVFNLFSGRSNSELNEISDSNDESFSCNQSNYSSKLSTPLIIPANSKKTGNKFSNSPKSSEDCSLTFHVNPIEGEGYESN